MVRRSAEIFCKESISTTPSLPSEAEYISLQEKREKKIEERIAYERQLEIEEAIRERRKDQRVDSRNSSSTGQSSKTNEVIKFNLNESHTLLYFIYHFFFFLAHN